jgi:lysophospholipase L1-like esterase
MQLAECTVHFLGVPGLNLNKIAKSEDLLLAFHPQLIILQIGGNDLCKHSYSAERVAHDIIDLAYRLQYENNNCNVLVSQLIPRVRCPVDYNDKVHSCNHFIASRLGQDSSTVALWKHKGIWCPKEWICDVDGVHFNEVGQFKLFNSYRAAAIFVLRSY